MLIRRVHISLLISCCVATACSKRESPAGNPASTKIEKEWKTYQDEKVRVAYPDGWQVRRFSYPKESEDVWSVEPPGSMEDDLGLVMISEKTGGKQRSFESFVKAAKMGPSRFINAPKNLKFKWGRCISYPKERKYGDMFAARIQSHCYRDNGNYLSIWADIGKYADNTKPDEDSLKNARIYERVLESLEFL